MSKHANLRLKPEMKRAFIRVGGAFAVGALILAGTIGPSLALEKQTVANGLAACDKWCDANNPGPVNNLKCKQNCLKYWCCNGSDARTETNRACCKNAGGVTGITTKTPTQGTLQPKNPQPQSPATVTPPTTKTTP